MKHARERERDPDSNAYATFFASFGRRAALQVDHESFSAQFEDALRARDRTVRPLLEALLALREPSGSLVCGDVGGVPQLTPRAADATEQLVLALKHLLASTHRVQRA